MSINNVIEISLDAFPPLLTKIGSFLFVNKKARIITLSLLLVFILIFLGLLLVAIFNINDKQMSDNIFNKILPFTIVPIVVILLPLMSYAISKTPDELEMQLSKIREERVEITHKIEKEKDLDIFNTTQLSLNHLTEYYTINKSQARSSFRFSIFSIVVGLFTIIVGIWLFYFGYSNIQVTFIAGISGLLLEFIGGAYFFMYKKSLEQVNFFFGQLIKVQDTMLSINLAKNLTDNNKKMEMIEKIIVSLLERSLK